MQVTDTKLAGVKIIEPKRFGDDRGYFLETFQAERYRDVGIHQQFVQDNCSRSSRGVLRGLHYQIKRPQGKLVCVTRGSVFDVAVDLRAGSQTFGDWVGVTLSDDNAKQLYIPPGFAHGFCVLSDTADFTYKCTDYYAPEHERSLLWNDPSVGIDWPLDNPTVSAKDAQGVLLKDAEVFDKELGNMLKQIDKQLRRTDEFVTHH